MRVHGSICPLCNEEMLGGDPTNDAGGFFDHYKEAHSICICRRDYLGRNAKRRRRIRLFRELALPIAAVVVLWLLNRIAL